MLCTPASYSCLHSGAEYAHDISVLDVMYDTGTDIREMTWGTPIGKDPKYESKEPIDFGNNEEFK